MNMSGQKNLNPFAATSWTPSAASTASKTVADAQAERRQRQQERDRLRAAESIQRTWRGHRVRRNLKDGRRKAFDELYQDGLPSSSGRRADEALHLVVTTLDPSRPDDRSRLQLFAEDLQNTNCAALSSASTVQLKRLVPQFLVLLKRCDKPRLFLSHGQPGLTRSSSNYDEVPTSVLAPIVTICRERQEALQDSLENLYSTIGGFCRNDNIRDSQSLELLEQAILVPMQKETQQRATTAFAMCFLTQPNLELFENHVAAFAERIDVEKVSAAIVSSYDAGWATSQPADVRLWLLAHFIALGNSKKAVSLGSSYLNAMYVQLSSLHVELKKHHVGQDAGPASDHAEESKRRLPSFVEKSVESLVKRDEISHILEKFTTYA